MKSNMKNENKQKVCKLVSDPGYNPFFLQIDFLNTYEIEAIKFFDKDGVKYSVRWFDVMRRHKDGSFTDVAKYPIAGNNAFREIDLPCSNVPLARKIAFDKYDAFVIKREESGRVFYDLYLNIGMFDDFASVDIADKPFTLRQTQSETRITFTVTGKLKYERDNSGSDTHRVIFYTNHKYNYTPYGTYCEKIAGILSAGMIGKTYSGLEVAELISTGKIDELAETIKNFRKEFPAENREGRAGI